ncbi:MAG: inositol-3-phosphate synthase [Gemmataceae bacterium]|nr:inositol-3-phosphate synthase [Gemmataceae bacterium]
MASRRVGIWLIGAGGAVGASVALGLSALCRGQIDTTGLVSALPHFRSLDLDPLDSIVLGGHDIREYDLATEAAKVGGGTPAYPPRLVDACRPDLDTWTRNGRPRAASVADFQRDLAEFATRHNLTQLVVINVASTESPAEPHPAHDSAEKLMAAARTGDYRSMPPSGWDALATISSGHPYVNFTPSCGCNLPGLLELASQRGVPVAGSDAKTGETLLKTVLAPMFAARNLRVLSWVGHNLLGNNDGRTLADPDRKVSKLKNKDQVVAESLGYSPQSLTSIEFVESLDDWKTAWDHIHFEGFLGVRMSLQFTWQGCDSALAAPLVIDLARFALLAQRKGEAGPMAHLGVFFKNPLGGGRHDFAEQWRTLREYAER